MNEPIKLMKIRPTFRRILCSLMLLILFAMVFAAYLQPAFIVDLANRYVFC